jgi:ribosomal protein S18 acetylase RimI-like enzyme
MMSSHSPAVTPVERSEIAAAGAMLSRAFYADPLWVATIPDGARRPELLAGVFAGLVKTTIAAKGLVDKTPDLAGVALWHLPGRDLGLRAMVGSGLVLPRSVMSLPRQDRKRMMLGLRQIGARRSVLMPEPHWYVAAIGVDPDSQGEGLGSVLMEHGIARADRDDKPIYLETETERNVGFYQRLGFDVVEEFRPDVLNVPMWLMARRGLSSLS